jgi:histidine triad (HIT) family protein
LSASSALRRRHSVTDCLFCRLAASPDRPPLLYEDELVLAFDMPADHPEKRAPVHFLVIPREHIASARDAEARHEQTLGRLITVAARLAQGKGIAESGYRLVSNTGPDANQTVFHLHMHCLGGAKLAQTG